MQNAPGTKTDELAVAAQLRLQRWLLSPDLCEHMQHARDAKKRGDTGPYIAVSRQAGSSGTQVARLIGQRMGWDVLDKELLDFMAQRYHMPRDMLDVVDETRANWFHDLLSTFLDSRVVGHDKYVVYLERIIYLAALHGDVVFVGRGAQFVLPPARGLSVRVFAPRRYRVERIMERHGITREKASALIDEIDAARKEFCERHFHRKAEDPEEYDLLINSGRTTIEDAADLIIDAFRRRHGFVDGD